MRDYNIKAPRLLDRTLQEIGRLNPVRESPTMRMQPLSTAELELAPDDPYVEVGMFVELYTISGSIGIFRVSNVRLNYGSKNTRTISLEHGIVTLADNLLFGYHEYGGGDASTGEAMYVNDVIDVLLSYQEVQYWERDTSIPENQTMYSAFSYSFENENVLSALISLTEPMPEQMIWTFDFSSFPWKVGLRKLNAIDDRWPTCECRMHRNMSTATVNIDINDLITRIYPLGYGEGVDQLTVEDAYVNGVRYGLPYIQDDEAVAEWGILQGVYTETTVADPATLYNMAKNVLDAKSTPVVTITVSALELADLTGEPWDHLELGRVCRMAIPDHDVVMEERIIEMTWSDVYNRPRDIKLTLANKLSSTEDTIANLSKKTSISELCSQGAASEYGMYFADNADPSYPAIMRFYVGEDTIHINKVLMRYYLKPYRGYANTTSAGGLTTVDASQYGYNSQILHVGPVINYISPENHSHSSVLKLPSHSHGIQNGIQQAATLEAKSVSIAVDGNPVPQSAINSDNEVDLVSYLSKGEDGKIKRNIWHEVKFTPDALCRVELNMYIRTFIRSLTGAKL